LIIGIIGDVLMQYTQNEQNVLLARLISSSLSSQRSSRGKERNIFRVHNNEALIRPEIKSKCERKREREES
jgi:hypothetical protein